MNYSDYDTLGFTKLEQSEFNGLVTSAQLLIDGLTNDYYNLHDISDDLKSDVPFKVYRAKQYERAVALQCEFAHISGASTIYEQSTNDLSSYSVDGTTMSFKNGLVGAATYGQTGVAIEAYRTLSQTGLLYRGVGYR